MSGKTTKKQISVDTFVANAIKLAAERDGIKPSVLLLRLLEGRQDYEKILILAKKITDIQVASGIAEESDAVELDQATLAIVKAPIERLIAQKAQKEVEAPAPPQPISEPASVTQEITKDEDDIEEIVFQGTEEETIRYFEGEHADTIIEGLRTEELLPEPPPHEPVLPKEDLTSSPQPTYIEAEVELDAETVEPPTVAMSIFLNEANATYVEPIDAAAIEEIFLLASTVGGAGRERETFERWLRGYLNDVEFPKPREMLLNIYRYTN